MDFSQIYIKARREIEYREDLMKETALDFFEMMEVFERESGGYCYEVQSLERVMPELLKVVELKNIARILEAKE